MGIFRPQKYIFMTIKLFTNFSIKCYEESHKINEWKFSCDTTRRNVNDQTGQGHRDRGGARAVERGWHGQPDDAEAR